MTKDKQPLLELIEQLRERGSEFANSTYKALQAGQADPVQQRAAAAGIVVDNSMKHKAAEALQSLLTDCAFLLSVIDRCDETEAPSCEMEPEDVWDIARIRTLLGDS